MTTPAERLAELRAQARAGKVGTGQAQHVDLYRKLLLRRRLLTMAPEGAAYVPFVGDGDIAVECYAGRPIFAADLDPERVATAGRRLPGAQVLVADCDRWPPFTDLERFAVGDFDAWAYPYAAFRAWWENAERTDRVVAFFTDGQRLALKRGRLCTHPDGGQLRVPDLTAMRKVRNAYWTGTVAPWLAAYVAPWRVVIAQRYLRNDVLYFGVVLDSPS